MRLIDAEPLDCLAWQDGEHGTTFDDGVRWVLSKIDEQPTIEERKTGKWIIHETETDRYDDMKCPFCKKSYTVDAYRIDDIGFTAADFNFCPNCGADMRGEDDEPL